MIQNQIARGDQFNRAQELLQRVGLSKDSGSRRLSEFSGGQRQRLAIARAFALDPKLLILDEAFSALDCSVQAQMVNLLVELQASIGITCLFITHDLAMAALLGDQIAVMECGKIVESGDARDVVLHPLQKCTRDLLAASPRMNQSLTGNSAKHLMRYLLRRFVHAIFLLLGVSVLSFAFTAIAPGNYFDEMRLNPQISPDTVTALRAHYGVDRPMIVRYARWLASVAHGDLGFSFAYNSPAAPLLWARAWNTLLLTITATFFSWLIALPSGNLERRKKNQSSRYRNYFCNRISSGDPRSFARVGSSDSRRPHRMVSNWGNGFRWLRIAFVVRKISRFNFAHGSARHRACTRYSSASRASRPLSHSGSSRFRIFASGTSARNSAPHNFVSIRVARRGASADFAFRIQHRRAA